MQSWDKHGIMVETEGKMETENDITIDKVRTLLSTYEAAGISDTSSGRFLKNIVSENQLPSGSRAQWLKDLFKRQELIKQAKELIELASQSRRSDIADTLRDFAKTLARGYELSERQQRLLGALRQQVVENLPDRELTVRDKEMLLGLAEAKRHMSYYWANRPSISRRLDKVFLRFHSEGAISQGDWDYVCSNFKGRVDQFDGFSKRRGAGSLMWAPRASLTPVVNGQTWVPVLIIGETKFSQMGDVIVDVMLEGGVHPIMIEKLRTRKPS